MGERRREYWEKREVRDGEEARADCCVAAWCFVVLRAAACCCVLLRAAACCCVLLRAIDVLLMRDAA
jgi:hypothetical protein